MRQQQQYIHWLLLILFLLLHQPTPTLSNFITHVYSSRRIYNFPFQRVPAIGADFSPDTTYPSNLVVLPREVNSLCDISFVATNPKKEEEEEEKKKKQSPEGGEGGKEEPPSSGGDDGNNRRQRRRRNAEIPLDLALLVHYDNHCSILTHAQNALTLASYLTNNERLGFLVLIGSKSYLPTDETLPPSYFGENNDDATSKTSLHQLRIATITTDAGYDLLRLFHSVYEPPFQYHPQPQPLPERGYLRGPPSSNPFVVYFGENKYDVSLLWVNTLYLFLVIILVVPIVRFLILLVVHRGLRWRRDGATGRITGVTWNLTLTHNRSPYGFDGDLPGNDGGRGRRLRRGGVGGRRAQAEWYRESLREGLRAVLREGVVDGRFVLRRMTEDDVNRLPKIQYGVSDIEEVGNRYDKDTSAGTKKEGDDGTSSIDNNNNDRGSDDDTNNQQPTQPSSSFSTEQTTSFLQNAYASYTNCSICIEEFDHGETLVLLPQCGHFFHPDCITPWLMEKKGTCPLCQSAVVPLAVSSS